MPICRIALLDLQDLALAVASGECSRNFPIRATYLYKQVTKTWQGHFIGIIFELLPELPYDATRVWNIVIDGRPRKFQVYLVGQRFKEGCRVARSFVKRNPIRLAIMDGRAFSPGLLFILT